MATQDDSVDALHTFTPHLWAIAIVFFVVGDLVTTGLGLSFQRTIEVGPVAATAVESYGLQTLVPLKLFTILVCVALWKAAPPPEDVGVPLALAALGILVTLRNAYVLAGLL